MALWFAALLGLVQGLTEFLPISSTAHLRIAPELLGQPDPGAAFSAVVQLGTLAAVIAYFARELFVVMPRAMLTDPRSPDGRMPLYMIVGTIPIGIAGLAFKDYIVGDLRSLYVVGGALIAVAVIMWAADRRAGLTRRITEVTLRDALIVGCAQACALVPGASRSGSTIVACLLLGMARPDAARFSFLLGIPAIGAAGVFELKDALEAAGSDWTPILVGTLAAAVSGYASIAWLMRFLGKRSFTGFVVYRVALGAILITLCLAGVLSA